MKNSVKIAFCGLMAALATVFLLLTVVPTAEIALPALAGLTMVPVVIEAGKRAALMTYAGVSVLALLLAPSLESRVLFVAFFGFYPILKAILEGKCRRWVAWVLKFGMFNLCVVAAYAVMLLVLHMDGEMFSVAGVSLPWVFLAAGNLIFLLYDVGMTRVIGWYLVRLRPLIRKRFRF